MYQTMGLSMGRPQFSAPREAWSWGKSAQHLVGALIPTFALAVVLAESYGLLYSIIAILVFAVATALQVMIDRRVMVTE